jgi:hypothetical protein
MLIFSVSINSNTDNIYLSLFYGIFLWSCYLRIFHLTLISKRCQGRM